MLKGTPKPEEPKHKEKLGPKGLHLGPKSGHLGPKPQFLAHKKGGPPKDFAMESEETKRRMLKKKHNIAPDSHALQNIAAGADFPSTGKGKIRL